MSLIYLLADAATTGEAEQKVFPAFDPVWVLPQLFWLAIFFGILYIGLSRFILPRLSDTIEKRGNRIASDLDEAASLNDQATEAQQALELRMAEAKAGARATADKTRAKIDTEIAAETARIDAELDERLGEAETRLAAMRTEAMSKVKDIASDATTAITEQFGVKVSDSAATSAVSDVLEQGA